MSKKSDTFTPWTWNDLSCLGMQQNLLWHGFFYTCTHLLSRLFQLRVASYISFPRLHSNARKTGKLPPTTAKKISRLPPGFRIFFRWLFRFHSHCRYCVPRFRPSLYFTSSLFPNLPAVASKIILLRKSYVFTLQWFCIHADNMENAWFYFGFPWLIWQFVV